MNGVKIVVLTAMAHLSKLLITLFILKQIAITQGPEGLGLLGNFMTLVTLAATLAGGGIMSGVIKYIAEYSGSLSRQFNLVGSAIVYALVAAAIVVVFGVIFINQFSSYIFLSDDLKKYIYFFLFAQVFIGLNNVAYGVMNGLRKTDVYALFVICGNLIAAPVAYYGIKYYGMGGAVIAIMAPATLAIIPVLIYIKVKKINRQIGFNSILKDSRLLSRFSLMLIVSAICFPIVEMCIRNLLVEGVGLTAAGYWQAITKLSSAYLSFYSLFLMFYFVPIISAAVKKDDVLAEVKKMLFFVISLFATMMVVFFSIRTYVIQWIFSAEFVPVSNLFILQMLGDFFRVIGWVIGFVVVAKALTKLYIISEIFQGLLFVTLSYLELSYAGGLQGVIIAYVITCACYCLVSIFLFYYVFREKQVYVSVD